MTQRLFEGTPLAVGADARFAARVTAIRREDAGTAVVLDRSQFYPTGGGQPCDLGTLDGVAVVEVLEEGEQLLHRLESHVDWAVERAVTGEVDLERRLDHMQQHTGQHLLSAVLVRDHGLQTVSFHLGRELCSIDVVADAVSAETLTAAEAACNAAVRAALPVRVEVFHGAAAEAAVETLRKRPAAKALGSQRGLRVVQLGPDEAPLDRDACCGTHAGHLGQLGALVVLGSERGKQGHTRIAFAVGGRAIAAVRERLDALSAVCLALNTGHADAGERARGLVAQVSEQGKALKRLEQEVARDEATRLAAERAPARVQRVTVAGPKALTVYAQTYLAAHPAGVLVLVHADARTSLVVAKGPEASADVDAGALLRELLAPHEGKGGGSPTFAQGTAPDPGAADAIEEAAIERLG